MTMTDPIADMLTRIRNAIRVGKPSCQVPSSKMKMGLALLLKDEGYISDVRPIEDADRPTMEIDLKYSIDGESAIHSLQRVSKPGCREYARSNSIPTVRNGLGTAIVSTSKGLLTGEKAGELGVGGELICTIY